MQSFSLVLFGATGDLAKIKILPAIYTLYEQELLPGTFTLIATGRTKHSQNSFHTYVKQILEQKFGTKLKDKLVKKMLAHTYYIAGDTGDPLFYQNLKLHLEELQAQGVECQNRIYHLAILPELYANTVENLGKTGLHHSPDGWVRIMIEKPFGENYESAQVLNKLLTKYFPENSIYRLDHYLGKETVMNILAFRFGNGLLEPIWNHKFIDHIQIQVLENFGVGQRGRFYDATGALRDVVQNHLLQVLATTLMDRPDDFSVGKVRAKRQEILGAITRYTPESAQLHVVPGQYHGYLQEKDVPDYSTTETYVALKMAVDKNRWKGVPIYMRAGKRLHESVSEISIVFKKPPTALFLHDTKTEPMPTILTLRLQPNEGLILRLAVKKPGPNLVLTPATMDFYYDRFDSMLLEAYVKLLLDCFHGDQTNFALMQEISAQWQFVDPIINSWESLGKNIAKYEPGTWGPEAADELLKRDKRAWVAPVMK